MKSKNELRLFLREDLKANGIDSYNQYVIRLLFRAENACVVHYLKALRHLEYHIDNLSSSLFHRLAFFFWKFRTSRLGYKYSLMILPNTVGYGLRIPHIRGGVIINAFHIGNYCIINSGVVVGNKGSHNSLATIGERVELSVGCKVIGKVSIGDNAIVAPNAVVINDVPTNAIVGGIPATILKFKELGNNR